MRRAVLLLLFLLLAVSCRSGAERLRSGDLIFVGIPRQAAGGESMDGAIAVATGRGRLNWIHVAIADVSEEGVFVIDATGKRGVHRHPLDSLIRDFSSAEGPHPVFAVGRLISGYSAPDALARARSFLGEPYDYAFLPDNGAQYCSELVRNCFLSPGGDTLFPQRPMNFLAPDGSLPAYWAALYDSLGVAVPQGLPGTNPQDMAEDPVLEILTGIEIPSACR